MKSSAPVLRAHSAGFPFLAPLAVASSEEAVSPADPDLNK